jgi:hypothetical protein
MVTLKMSNNRAKREKSIDINILMEKDDLSFMIKL